MCDSFAGTLHLGRSPLFLTGPWSLGMGNDVRWVVSMEFTSLDLWSVLCLAFGGFLYVFINSSIFRYFVVEMVFELLTLHVAKIESKWFALIAARSFTSVYSFKYVPFFINLKCALPNFLRDYPTIPLPISHMPFRLLRLYFPLNCCQFSP